MNVEYNLIYPTVDLFVYDLQEGLGQTDEQINQNRHHFWRKIKPELNKDYQTLNSQEQGLLKQLALLEKAEADYVELLVPKKKEHFQPDLEGYYRALQLSDTYALQVDCSIINDNNSKPISRFQDIKKNIESRIDNQPGKLGQTWFVWGQLSKIYNDEEIQAIAQECYKQINPNSQSKIDFKKQGNFLGATAFEVWEQPNALVNENSFHVLICLFPAQRSLDDITKNIANIYFDLNRLFCYRHKIIWAYHQSRKLKSKLKKDFHEVQQIVKKVSELGQQINAGKLNLQELQETLTDTLTILSHYEIDLSYLDDQGRTIEVNLNNYKKRLEKISKENSNNQLQFLQEFSEFSAEKYLQQVKTDYINLSPGLTLLQNLISTIQGTIDIYQAKSDRHLEEFIGIAGVGLATSQIGSAVILAEIPKNQNPLTYQIQIFTLSLFIGLIFAALTYILLRSRRR
ncbi:hypothetical protein H6G81_10850 [Scytonema hofmannii FACHB-248]|uniref:Uncharacterized protein n=1 Tax=Scytonema hofmannii FACHB-248 TaxID=1842502 RepID=A0ABR8GNL3_9CYAN|nr:MULTISPECIES: hypothetical protein [Nostocales]MBD2605014.1 hypothetical protein [Scytonema hofmannii FACHB-248]